MEEIRSIFKKYKNRLVFEGVLKSLLWGAVIGFAVNLIFVAILFITAVDLIWVSAVTCAVIVAATMLILYFKKYRPTAQKIAERVDLLGLEERLITMVELENDDSYIAMRQREDAKAALSRVQGKGLKISLHGRNIALAAIVTVVSLAATAYTSMSLAGGAPSFGDMIDSGAGQVEYVEISYDAGDGGFVTGEIYQMLTAGEDASEVMAVAEDGYMFDKWSDGVTTPARKDTEVFMSMQVTAEFTEIPEPNDQVPPDDDIDMGQMEGDSSEMPGNIGVAGKYEEYNQVIDGNTYYRDVYQKYYDDALAILEAGGVVPDAMRQIIEAYFGVIL